MKRNDPASPRPHGLALPLPRFLIARHQSGRLSVRELAPEDNAPAMVERLRARPDLHLVWLAHAYQAATGAGCEVAP